MKYGLSYYCGSPFYMEEVAMRYYKLVNGKNIIGVATQENFRRIKEENSILLVCDVDSA